jgi:hypothetical protein
MIIKFASMRDLAAETRARGQRARVCVSDCYVTINNNHISKILFKQLERRRRESVLKPL